MFIVLFFIHICLNYSREFPLHFIAKVKVKVIKGICVISFHIITFCYGWERCLLIGGRITIA